VHEASWVRSVYLYLMCLASVVLVGLGAVGFALGLVHTIAPDLGHRDTLDRIGIGLANIATEVVDLVGEADSAGSEDFCRDVTDSDADFDDCMADQGSGDEATDAIQDGISEVKSELQSQIRNNSIDHMIRGLLLIGAGIFLFHIHGRRTELFADGFLPKPPAPATPAVPATPTTTPPVAPIPPVPPVPPVAPIPPPPGAPPPT
jgi:hypothetical protein